MCYSRHHQHIYAMITAFYPILEWRNLSIREIGTISLHLHLNHYLWISLHLRFLHYLWISLRLHLLHYLWINLHLRLLHYLGISLHLRLLHHLWPDSRLNSRDKGEIKFLQRIIVFSRYFSDKLQTVDRRHWGYSEHQSADSPRVRSRMQSFS